MANIQQLLQTSDLDTFLCKQEWERRLEEELDKPRRDSASQIDDFFEPTHNNNRHQPAMSYVSMRTLPGTDDDVFLRPPLWEDIASSIQNIDPENANMLGVSPGQVLQQPGPTLHLMGTPTSPYNQPQPTSPQQQTPHYHQQPQPPPQPIHHPHNNNNTHPQYKYNNVAQGPAPGNALYPMSRLMYVSPLTPPSSEPGSPGGNLPRRTPPPPYPAPGCPQQTPAATVPRISSGVKFNRRNNPELEKRRIHHCDFIGKCLHAINSILFRPWITLQM
ncbi:hypothetical protein NQ317_005114 [Molorchus minor]|uniref:Uncharacterized protein n=1 Tax=Molorchus minor TaxID=1323400 RepID=A0ABQ9JYN4_9CUCU|nr:hypothetical protein NQ317_005114 [Molorchus minor]